MNTHDYIDTNYLHDNSADRERRDNNNGTYQGESGGMVKASRWLFIAAMFVLPFIFIPIAGWSVSVGKVVLMSLLGLSAGAMFLTAGSKKATVLPRTFTGFFLGLLALLTLSTFLSESVMFSVFGANLEVGTFLTTAVAVVLALLAPVVLTDRKHMSLSLAALLAGGIVLGLFHLLRLFFGPEFLSFGHFFDPSSSPVGSWYDVGVFFSVTYLISLSVLTFGSFPSNMRSVFGVMLGLSLLFVALSGFSILLLLLGVATLAFLGVTFISARSKTIMPAAISFVILLVSMIFLGSISNTLRDSANLQYSEAKPTWFNTQQMLGAGLGDMKTAAIGKGPNTFTYLWQESRTQEVIDDPLWWPVDFPFASGLIPTFAITFGLVTTGLMIAFAVYLGIKVFAVMRNNSSDPFLATVAISSGVAGLFLWILSFFHVFSTVPFILMFLLSGIAMAALAKAGSVATISTGRSKETTMIWSTVGAVICVVLIIPMLVISTSRTIYGRAVTTAQRAEDIETIIVAQNMMRRASMLERNDTFARIESELGLIRLQEVLSRENEDEADLLPELEVIALQTQEAADRALRLNSRNYLNHVNAGLIYETLGFLQLPQAYEFAAINYENAFRFNPTNPALPLMSARLEILRENQDAAIAFAERSLEVKRNYADAHLFLTDVALAEENVEGAIDQLNEGITAITETTPRIYLANTNLFFLHFELGLIHYAEGDFETAENSFSNAISLYPDYANARYFRALARVYGDNDREGALSDLERIAAANADNELLASIIENVRAGLDPLEGIEDDSDVVGEDGSLPTSNVDAVRELEAGSDPENLPEGSRPGGAQEGGDSSEEGEE